MVFGLVFAFAPPARAADAPVCSAVLYDDAELLKALPPRLQPIVESARFRTVIANGDAVWATFHQALDRGLASPGKRFSATVGDASVTFHFRARTEVSTALWRITDVSKALDLVIDDLRLGAKPDGLGFLNFVAAELGWIAKARATGKLERGLKIYGRDLESPRLADLLASIGFRKSKWPGPQCYLYGVAGGLLGYAGGHVFFGLVDANDENGSIYEEQRKFYRDVSFGSLGGAGIAVASACFNKTGRNYSIDFDPNEVPKKTDPIPDDANPNDPIPTEPPKKEEPAPNPDEPAPKTDVTPVPTALPTPAPTGI
jgi:hypothetical protein